MTIQREKRPARIPFNKQRHPQGRRSPVGRNDYVIRKPTQFALFDPADKMVALGRLFFVHQRSYDGRKTEPRGSFGSNPSDKSPPLSNMG